MNHSHPILAAPPLTVYSRLMDDDVFPTPDSSPSPTNHLEEAASSYLRSARHQPVWWHPWGAAAFARAQAEDKPILLDIGAVWCHWCHVMDRESYEDPEIAALINQLFVAVKVDRDERPDVDARYQSAVAAISGQGGWPLTAFLTPSGQPYFGGTYIPPDDRYGRPGIRACSGLWRRSGASAATRPWKPHPAPWPPSSTTNFSGRGGELMLGLVDKLVSSILTRFDPLNGGFGSQPKFPHPAALDLLLQVAMNRENPGRRKAFATTLEKMAQGGVYDQLAGGFHRYSVDERWGVPHFEKMLYDNTELLRNYVHGFQSFHRQDFLETANEIVSWLDATMTDRERGGFYASQDADINLDDDGDYFTWTLPEARAVLDPAERVRALRYWDLRELGDMHHNPAKNVLHLNQSIGELAAEDWPQHGRSALDSGPARPSCLPREPCAPRLLSTARSTPDGMRWRSARTWKRRGSCANAARDFALLTLDRLLNEAWNGDPARPRHRISAKAPQPPKNPQVRSTTTPLRFTPAWTHGSPPAR